MKTELIYRWVKVLAAIGITLALYLLWQQMYKPAFQPCNINATVNCDAVVSGPVAKTLGIPTPLIGLVGYIVIMIAAFYKKTKLVLGMAAFGLAFCLYIAYIELFLLNVICPVCVACQIDMITVFILGIILNRKPKK
jgi:uncharacterized membrane protein